jgi:hypothetical protein
MIISSLPLSKLISRLTPEAELVLYCTRTNLDISFQEFWQRKETVILGETSVETFGKEDLLLLLCVQIAKDC